jgi:hypothetical protein
MESTLDYFGLAAISLIPPAVAYFVLVKWGGVPVFDWKSKRKPFLCRAHLHDWRNRMTRDGRHYLVEVKGRDGWEYQYGLRCRKCGRLCTSPWKVEDGGGF